MFLKNVVLHEIYSKKSQWPNTFGTSLYKRTQRKPPTCCKSLTNLKINWCKYMYTIITRILQGQ
jgi:hypothetical protein